MRRIEHESGRKLFEVEVLPSGIMLMDIKGISRSRIHAASMIRDLVNNHPVAPAGFDLAVSYSKNREQYVYPFGHADDYTYDISDEEDEGDDDDSGSVPPWIQDHSAPETFDTAQQQEHANDRIPVMNLNTLSDMSSSVFTHETSANNQPQPNPPPRLFVVHTISRDQTGSNSDVLAKLLSRKQASESRLCVLGSRSSATPDYRERQ
jgi:hypothetical protein